MRMCQSIDRFGKGFGDVKREHITEKLKQYLYNRNSRTNVTVSLSGNTGKSPGNTGVQMTK